MRKIMFVGRSESGKTTIMQAMKGKPITYHKTQYVNNFDVIIDTPGEYAETKQLSGALAVYGCEADVIGLLMSAIEPFSLYPPNIVSVSNREVVGVVTKCDHWAANPELAAEWLRLAGCKKIFFTSSYTGEGIAEILSYLKEPVDKLPWEVAKAEYDKLGFGPGESEKHTLSTAISNNPVIAGKGFIFYNIKGTEFVCQSPGFFFVKPHKRGNDIKLIIHGKAEGCI